MWPQLALGSEEVECRPPVCPGGGPELLVSTRTADHSHQPPITAFDRRDTEAQRGQLSERFTAIQAKATSATLDHHPSHDLRRRICSPPCAHSLNRLLLLQNNAPQNLMAKITTLCVLQFLWVRNSGRAQLGHLFCSVGPEPLGQARHLSLLV